MNVELDVPAEERLGAGPSARLGLVLGAYDALVPHALLRVDRQAAGRVTCRIDLAVRWWGRMTVEREHEQAQVAVQQAIDHVHELLEAFVSEIA